MTPARRQGGAATAKAAASLGSAASGWMESGGLVAVCAIIFIGAYGCGMAPQLFVLNGARSGKINALSAGLLIGSALCIMVPEGFDALHKSMEAAGSDGLPEWSAGLALVGGFWIMLMTDYCVSLISKQRVQAGHQHLAQQAQPPQMASTAADGSTWGMRAPGSGGSGGQRVTELPRLKHGHQLQQQPTRSQPSSPVRKRTVASAQSSDNPPAPGAPAPAIEATPRNSSDAGDPAGPPSQREAMQQLLLGRSGAVLLGLIVHAAADGLAVGSAALARQPSVSLAVSAGMVLHKLPVSVGLSSYLAAAGWPWKAINKAMLAFAAASPTAALLVYAALSGLGSQGWGSSDGGSGRGMAVALALLLSGGTVLYAAAVHVLPDALALAEALPAAAAAPAACEAQPSVLTGRMSSQGDEGCQGPDDDEEHQLLLANSTIDRASKVGDLQGSSGGPEPRRDVLVWLSGGMLLPLLLSIGVHHEHGGHE